MRAMTTMMAVLAFAFAAEPALADSTLPPSYYADHPLPDARQEGDARTLMESLRCLVCQSQSIADSHAEMAGDMRALVRERIAAGEKPEDVRRWLIDRYGDWVSFRPPVEPSTWPLWGAPVIFLLIGGLMVWRYFRGRRA